MVWYRPNVVTQSVENARSSVAPGTRFGRYEVIAEIASGGMATVYLGRVLGAAGFQRLVAIKCLHPHVGRDNEFVVMFMDEARLAARIRHPNVVPTLDLDNGSDGLFLVMEYVEGDGLLSLLRAGTRDRERMPQPVALRIILDVLHGLHAAHELTGDRGEPLRMVHRDVSPHNILVGLDGITRITDFGIARAEERIGATREGQVKGKLAYMAPEQTSGTPVDRRADVFACGAVLWECLAGRRLFQGANDGEVLRHLLVTPIPRLRELVPDLPVALDEVCARALARDPNERYATAAALADALEEAGGAVGIGSARAVASFVRQLSWSKIEAMQQQVRATTGDHSASVVRAARPRLMSDPERTMRRDSVPDLAREAIEDLSAEAIREATKDGLPAATVAVPGVVAPVIVSHAGGPMASAPPPAASFSPAYASGAPSPSYVPYPASAGATGAQAAARSGGDSHRVVLLALFVFVAVATVSGLVIFRSMRAQSAPQMASDLPRSNLVPTTGIVAPILMAPPAAPVVAAPPVIPPPPPSGVPAVAPQEPPRVPAASTGAQRRATGRPSSNPPASTAGHGNEPYNPEAM